MRSWFFYVQIHMKMALQKKKCAQGSGKLPSEYLGFQSNGLEFAKCQILGLTCATIWWKKKQSQEAEFQERIQKKWACLHHWGSFLSQAGFWIPLPIHIWRYHHTPATASHYMDPREGGGGLAWLWKFKAHQAPTVLIVTSRNPGHSAGAHWACFFPT